MEISAEALEDLRYAKGILENPSLSARIVNFFGLPVEKAFKLLPARWSDAVTRAAQTALATALHVAVATLADRGPRPSSDILHKVLVTATGAAGGAFGLAALPIELPVSTTVMPRSIADIARNEGERIRLPEVRLACLEVFALGGRTRSDDAAGVGEPSSSSSPAIKARATSTSPWSAANCNAGSSQSRRFSAASRI